MSSILNFHPIPNSTKAIVHLSEDEIDDQLIGDLAAAPAAHLDACALCTHRVAQAKDPIASFQSLTMAWSERRSATLPIPNRSMNRPLWQRRAAWVTACSALAIGIAFTNVGHRAALPVDRQLSQGQPSQLAAPQAAAVDQASRNTVTPPAEQISADNQMLQAIDDEIHTAPNSPAALGLAPVSDHSISPPATTSLQD
jgi:hypothetical protein